jgi:hypothetical protein
MNRSVTAVRVPVRTGSGTEVEHVCSATMFRHLYATRCASRSGKSLAAHRSAGGGSPQGKLISDAFERSSGSDRPFTAVPVDDAR